MIFYHVLDYDFRGLPTTPIAAKYQVDPFLKEFLSDKVLQRAWLNRDPAVQSCLPEKTMISAPSDINSAEELDKLVKNLITLFDRGSYIFIKSSEGALGKKNILLRITDEEALKAALKDFASQLQPEEYFTFESASFIGQSLAKKRVDTYRLFGILTHKEKNKPDFKTINLWHTTSKDENELSSHAHSQTDYFQVGLSEIHSEDHKIEHKPLSKAKKEKHLALEKTKPILFDKFKTICQGLERVDLKDAVSNIPVYKGDNKPFIDQTTRVVFSSAAAKQLTERRIDTIFSKIKSLEKLYEENAAFEGQRNPIQKIRSEAKQLQERDWNLIAEAAIVILTQSAEVLRRSKDPENDYKKFEAQLQQLVGKNALTATKAAKAILAKTKEKKPNIISKFFSSIFEKSEQPKTNGSPSKKVTNKK